MTSRSACSRSASARPDAAAGAILDGFPRTAVQAVALDAFLGTGERGVDAALLIDVPAELLVERLSGRLVCRAGGHPYHLMFNPPRQAGICDLDGSPLVQRADDAPETIRARLSRDARRPERGRGPLPRDRRAPRRRWTSADRRGLGGPRGGPRPGSARDPIRGRRTDMVTRKSKREIELMRRAGRIVAEVLALVEGELRPGVTTALPRRDRRAPHPGGRRRRRRSWATWAAADTGAARRHFRPAPASRSTTRSSTAFPATG